MDGQAIAGQPIGAAGLRRLASEQDGPRPDGVRGEAAAGVREGRLARATRP